MTKSSQRTERLSFKVKADRAARRNKEKRWKRTGKIKQLRSKLGPSIQKFRNVLDKLDLGDPHETIVLNKMMAYAESDPRFGCTEEQND